MPRARSPNRELAYQLWAESGGKRELKDIAAQIGVAPQRVRKWKSVDEWEKRMFPNGKGNAPNRVPKRKRGGQPGNQNAVGKDCGALPGNANALKHGGYSPVYWDTLTDEEKALLENAEPDSETLLREEIELLSIRERRIMGRIRKISAFDEKAPGGLGQVVAGVVQNEDKRKFDNDEDKALFESIQRAKIESGNLLPGHKYSVSSRTEAVYDVIQRLEEALTRVQAQKQRCVHSLIELQTAQQDQSEIEDLDSMEGMIYGEDSGGGTDSQKAPDDSV